MKFSIVCTFYQNSESIFTVQRFLDSCKAQEFKDFELIMLHDGPLLVDEEIYDFGDLNYSVYYTKERANKWGHNLRQLGINYAEGEYILHTNADNLYYPSALKHLYEELDEHEIYIMKVFMRGLKAEGAIIYYDNPRDYSTGIILKGRPVRAGAIDMMQLIASSRIWKKYGWTITAECSDAVIYELLCKMYEPKYIAHIIGEHY